MIPLFDLVITLFMAGYAVAERGTWIGWLMTALVLWQTYTLINFIRNTYLAEIVIYNSCIPQRASRRPHLLEVGLNIPRCL